VTNPSTDDQALFGALTARLQGQLSDPKAAEAFARYVYDVVLTWRPPAIPVETADTVIAFSLGLRAEDVDDPMAVAGPVNEQITAAVVEIARRNPAIRVFAQWEIARVLHLRHGMTNAFSVERVVTPEGTTYLSTRGVAEGAIVEAGGDPSALGKTVVAGHHDHAWRCVDVCRRLGIDAYAPEGIPLATGYDDQSLQNFTHSPDVWQIYDLAIRIGEERVRRIGG
jgi:hypothetical protein